MRKYIFLFTVIFSLFIPSAEARQHLPDGGYRKSCHQCSVDGNRLSCICKKRRGREQNTFIYLTPNCGPLENDNGILYCTRSGAKGGTDSDSDHDDRGDRGRHRGAFDVESGPIWNQSDAERKCPRVCDQRGGRWTGTWSSTDRGFGSVCGCKRSRHRNDDDGLGINIKF